uniref:uncharacterized protein n=1 Tax=Myxine glutinosa TaxID=7769 RepID=UPI00359004B2
MSLIGKMGEFCEEKEDWSQYMERLEFFFTANGIEGEERQRAVLLTVIGPAAFGLLKRLVEPRKVGRESFASLVETMREHLESEPSDIVHRFEFNSRERRPCESVALFNDDLSKLAERCNFGRVRDDMLRDRLVCGVNDQLIRRRLLSERQLTYERALEIALGIETAAKDAQRTTSTLPARQGSMETGCHPHEGLRQRPSSPQRSMETGCHPHHGLRQRPSSPQRSMETGCPPHDGLRQRPSSPKGSMETECHPHGGRWQRPTSPKGSMETECHPHDGLRQRSSSPQRSMETGCRPHGGRWQRPSSPKGSMETGCHPHEGLWQRVSFPQGSMETGCHPPDGLLQRSSSPQGSMETRCYPHDGLRQRPSSPQGSMETGCQPHGGLRQRPSSTQEHKAVKSARSRGCVRPIPVWLEMQELMAEALQAVIMGLGLEVFRLLLACAGPASVRAKLCSLATRRFTSTVYARIFYFMESFCNGRPTVLDLRNGDDYFLRSLQLGMDSIIPLESGSPEEVVQKFPCTKCSYCFATVAAWQLHMERHRPVSSDKKHKCSECPYSTDDKRSLRIHTRVHTGEKPFTCSVCSKRFSQSSYRRRHMRIHNNDRPYSCTVCSKNFNRMSVLQQHTRIHTGERPYVCKVCAKAFSHPSSLQQHTRIHTGERPYVCKVCSKSFCHQSAFHKHSRTHTGERPHTCTLCGNKKKKFLLGGRRQHALHRCTSTNTTKAPKSTTKHHSVHSHHGS